MTSSPPPARLSRRVRLATRSSPLARWQTEFVASALRAASSDLEVELVDVTTLGDRDRSRPLHELGGQGVFVKEVQAAVLDGAADAAVHSAKDLPAQPAQGLVIAALPPRGNPFDALVGSTLDALAPGATVATGSVRRRVQLAEARGDLQFEELRGNIGTRLQRIPTGGAIVVAMAALERLGLEDQAAEVLTAKRMLPQVGQGAIAVECRVDDERARELLALIDDARTRRRVEAERAYLAALGGGCTLPVAAYAIETPGGALDLEGLIAGPDGAIHRHRSQGNDPGALGRTVAGALLDIVAS